MSLLNKSTLNKTELSELETKDLNNLTLEFREKRAVEIQKILKNCNTATLIDASDCYLRFDRPDLHFQFFRKHRQHKL